MNSRTVTVLLAALLLGGCIQDQEEPAKAIEAAVPEPNGGLIGPQPGMARSVPQLQNPFANNRVASVEGRRFFTWYNCAGCHGTHAGGGMGPTLRDSVWIYGNSPEAIFNSIAQGRSRGMPAWGTKLPADQIWKLVTYIHSLGTMNEPAPPPPAPPIPQPYGKIR